MENSESNDIEELNSTLENSNKISTKEDTNCDLVNPLLGISSKEVSENMIPSFTQSRPISSPFDIEDCLSNPPEWINRVVPIKKRSGYVIRNILTDCHTNEENFFARTRLDSRVVPKTLVCHDYKGGYLSDSYIPFEGSEDKTLATDGYTFYNWSQIDYFVYFSHHFITIPPLAWVNAGHKNGVKVLGTVITENNDGVKICDEQIFKTFENMKEFVYQLTEIQRTFGFDGWLLNIENEVKNSEILRDFVEVLTQESHKQDSESVVIWYDSVTRDGKLIWQDQLNLLNRCYFDSCDGIFLNYGWNEEKLINTAALAGARHSDVFVGIDVFGRNMFGGGKFNTYKAAEMVSKYNLSMALFAPGWTHEVMDQKPVETTFSRFLNRDDAFWASLRPYFYTHPINDFFETDFHIGLDSNYYNLYMQNRQTSHVLHPEALHSIPDYSEIIPLKTCDCLKRGYFESKNVCLISNANLRKVDSNYVHNIFACDIRISGNIGVFFLTKKVNDADLSTLGVTLVTSLRSGSIRKIKLLGQQKLLPVNNLTQLEVNQVKDDEIKYNFTLNGIARKHLRKWKDARDVSLSIYEFSTTSCDLVEIGATVHNGSSIYLLEFGIIKLNL